MIKNFLLLMIDSFVVVIDITISGIGMLKDYGVRVWKNNVMKRWVLEFMDNIGVLFRHIGNYLGELENIIQFKILYDKTTKPMKDYYKKLKKKHIF